MLYNLSAFEKPDSVLLNYTIQTASKIKNKPIVILLPSCACSSADGQAWED
jgi:hypothetical protein